MGVFYVLGGMSLYLLLRMCFTFYTDLKIQRKINEVQEMMLSSKDKSIEALQKRIKEYEV